jgi:hypothetical protein
MQRIVEPELLDEIHPSHPDAVKSRADLRRLNALMGNHRWIAGGVRRHLPEKGQILELGAGDGGLARLLRRKAPGLRGRYVAVDIGPTPADWPKDLAWRQADFRDVLASKAFWRPVKMVIANLFLHHFPDDVLALLGERLHDMEVFLACEPSRRPLHLWQGRFAAPFLNRLTRHDMPVSIRAGFTGEELPRILGLDATSWLWQTKETFFGSCRLRAVKLHSQTP